MTLLRRQIVRHGILASIVGMLSLGGITAHAQSTWDGGGANNDWTTGANWAGDNVPAFPADLVFSGTTRLAPNNNNPGNVVVKSVTFDATAGAFTVGGNAFTLGDGTTADYRSGGASQLDGDLQTIANNLTFSRGQHHITTAAGAGGLTLTGSITRGTGSATRFFPAGGPIKTSLTNVSGMLGAWATIEQASPAFAVEKFVFAKVDGSGNIVPYLDYTAADNINGFAMPPETTLPPGVNASSNIRWFGGPTAAENLVFAAGITDMNTFLYEGPQEYLARANIGAGNTLRFSDGGGIFRSNPDGVTNTIGLGFTGGTITAGHTSAPATLYIWKNTTVTPGGPADGEDDNNTINLNGTVITDNPSGGAVTVVSSGSGGVRTENSAHTFTGGLYINRGVWRAQNNVAAFGAGQVHVASGAQAYVQSDGTYANDFFINGIGINEDTFEVGAIRCNADGGVLTGTWTLTGNARMGARGSEAENVHLTDPVQRGAMWTGKITGNFDLELNIENGRTANTTLDGNTPTMIIASQLNDWGGNTTIGSGRTRLGNPDAPGVGEVIPHGPGKGNVTLFGETARELTILTLDSRTETINGLSSTGDLSKVFITNSTEGDATLRVGANNTSSTFGGVITDHLGKVHVTKIGSGAQTLTGVNAYTGDTRIEGGTLSITSGTLSSTADVYTSSSAIFDLSFPGTNTIDSLYIDGVGQVIGTWGSLTSAATNKRNFFTGNGTLTVSSVGVGSIPGDFDGDNDVDGQDLTGAPNGFNSRFGNDLAGQDFLAWQRNFGTPAPAVARSAPVPEPHALPLFGLVTCGFACMTRARRRGAV